MVEDIDGLVFARRPQLSGKKLCEDSGRPVRKWETPVTENQKRQSSDEESVAEKILRVQDLWDEIARSPHEIELTEEQRREAERRVSEHERNPGKYSTWEQVKRRLETER